MKSTKLLLIGFAIVLFSCSKKDDPKPTFSDSALAGSWLITDLTYSGKTTTTGSGISLTANFTGVGKNMNMTTIFNSNPKTVSSQGSYTITLTTSILGQSDTEDTDFEDVVTDGTWSINGDKLKVVSTQGTDEATIVELTATSLKLKIDKTETETSQGVSATSEVHATYTFKKK